MVDIDGGRDFVAPFKPGDRVGLGMRLEMNMEEERPPGYSENGNGLQAVGGGTGLGRKGANGMGLKVEVFFTRNGKRQGEWDLYEERDESEKGVVEGLGGERDLSPVIGACGGVEFQVFFGKSDWLYQPM